MDMEKKLLVNCVLCDTRKVDEEELKKFERIYINADCVLVDKRSKAIWHQLPVECNMDNMIQVEEGEEEIGIISYNGKYEITAGVPSTGKKLLCVNGTLVIHPGAEEVVKSFLQISVNGIVSYPKSMSACINQISVNGSMECYPDDYRVMGREWSIDRYFPIQAKKGGKYFSAKTIEITDATIDTALLVEKGIEFKTKELYVLEEKLSDCIKLFCEDTKFQVIPTGFRFVKGDMVWNREILLKYGNRLYVKGDMVLQAEDKEILQQIEGLYITGTLYLSKEQFQELNQKDLFYKKVEWIKGNAIWKKNKITVDTKMITEHPEGLSFIQCAVVQIDPEVLEQEIREKVYMLGCSFVKCSKKQQAAVELVGKNIAKVKCEEEEENKKEEEIRIINAERYVL